MAYVPRLWIANQVMHGVIRTVDRSFLLIPKKALTNIIGACVGRALKKYPVHLHGCMANTNHIHFVLSLTEELFGNGALFFQYLNGLLAREINRHWDRTGHVWGNRIRLEPCVDDQAAERMITYIMLNPVKDDLVEKIDHWMGFSTHRQLASGKAAKYTYIDRKTWWKHGGPLNKKPKSDYKKTVEVQTTPLPHWENLSPKQQRTLYADIVATEEAQNRKRRYKAGKTVLGMPAILREDPRGRPRSRPTKGRKPLCHASSKEAFFSFKELWKEFLAEYRKASAHYRAGVLDMVFPTGSFRPPLIAVSASGSS